MENYRTVQHEENYSASQFSKLTGIGLRKIYDDLAKGLIPHYRVGKKILIPESSKEVYLGPLLGSNVSEVVASEILRKIK